jgi:hypothetical protein
LCAFIALKLQSFTILISKTMNTVVKNGILALLLVFATAMTASAQIKPSAKKKTTPKTEQPEKPSTKEQTDTPAESESTDTKPSTSAKKKTVAKKTDQYFDESGGFKHRLWYGGSFNLGFDGDGQSYSLFTIGLTPMVGYKIIGGLSAGPRLGFNYSKYKVQYTANQTITVNLTDYTIGAFTRYKVFKNFFAHVEGDFSSAQIPGSANQQWAIIKDVNGKPFTYRDNSVNYYAGAGYNSGGLIGYEIMALYNFSVPKNSVQSPLELRFGFSYNF